MDDIKIVRRKRRSVAIVILPNGEVEVRAPKFMPIFAIKAFINSKSDWIKEKQNLVRESLSPAKKFDNGEKIIFLGNEYSLLLGNYIHIEIKDDKLLFPLALASCGQEVLEKWYIKQAKVIIKREVDYYVEKMGTEYNGISFSDTKSKWGSCTFDNRLQFNWRLIMAPLLVVRYVVLHELVHTTTKNHSAIFWNKVRQVNPSYKQQIKWLKINGNNLIV